MKSFTRSQERALFALACFGLVVPNGVFLYVTFASTALLNSALANPVAMVFIIEAFVLMLLFALLIKLQGARTIVSLAFIEVGS